MYNSRLASLCLYSGGNNANAGQFVTLFTSSSSSAAAAAVGHCLIYENGGGPLSPLVHTLNTAAVNYSCSLTYSDRDTDQPRVSQPAFLVH